MSSNIKQILKVYNVKPKKKQKLKAKPKITGAPRRGQRQDTTPLRSNSLTKISEPQKSTDENRRLQSLDPVIKRYLDEYRTYSYSRLPNSKSPLPSEDPLDNLSQMVTRSGKAREGLRSIQEKMIHYGLNEIISNGNLEAISELEDLSLDEINRPAHSQIDSLIHRYHQESKISSLLA